MLSCWCGRSLEVNILRRPTELITAYVIERKKKEDLEIREKYNIVQKLSMIIHKTNRGG